MVYVTFSQKWVKIWYADRLMRIWRDVITGATPDLWIKVFFYRDRVWFSSVDQRWYQYDEKQQKNVEVSHPGLKRMDKARVFFGDRYNFDDMELSEVHHNGQSRGNYRCAKFMGHGFYNKEWNFIHKHPKIKHCITLKIGESCTDGYIAYLMAHEYRHYLQWKKYGAPAMARRVDGRIKRPIRVEKDADDWALNRIKRLGYRYR